MAMIKYIFLHNIWIKYLLTASLITSLLFVKCYGNHLTIKERKNLIDDYKKILSEVAYETSEEGYYEFERKWFCDFINNNDEYTTEGLKKPNPTDSKSHSDPKNKRPLYRLDTQYYILQLRSYVNKISPPDIIYIADKAREDQRIINSPNIMTSNNILQEHAFFWDPKEEGSRTKEDDHILMKSTELIQMLQLMIFDTSQT